MAESRPGVGLVATKGLRYGTRRLVADDDFMAPKRDARLLVAIGKARYATADARPEPGASPSASPSLGELRQQYQTKFGKRPFNGWDAEALQAKIAAG